MRAVLIQGSPRRNGNTASLVASFARVLKEQGVETSTLIPADFDMEPCAECGSCEKSGRCVKRDDMTEIVFPAIRESEIIVFGTPVFFYNVPAKLKLLIDRCQTLWSRKYRLGLTDPLALRRQGVLLAQGATKGKNLFDGIDLTVAYTFDAVGSAFFGGLRYRRIERPGDMERHPTVKQDTRRLAKELLASFKPTASEGRALAGGAPGSGASGGEASGLKTGRRVLFVSSKDDAVSQAAAAYTRLYKPEFSEVYHAGLRPAENVLPAVIRCFEEEGTDILFRKPRNLEKVAEEMKKSPFSRLHRDVSSSENVLVCMGPGIETEVADTLRRTAPARAETTRVVTWKLSASDMIRDDVSSSDASQSNLPQSDLSPYREMLKEVKSMVMRIDRSPSS